MKQFLFLLIPVLFFITAANAQSIDDLRKIEALKKQLESTDDLTKVKKTVSPETEGKSLNVFKDTLSVPVIPASKKTVVKTKKSVALPYYGYDVFRNAKVDFFT